MARARTNIELDVEAVQRIMDRYELRTKTEAVDLAVKRLAVLPMTLEEALAMEGADAIGELPPEAPPRGLG